MVAGGHRPRSEKSERLRNRFLCKFLYYASQYDLQESSSCTGCGRCVEACPVNVDITEILSDFGRLE
jgi:ferredoxin